MEHDSEEYKKPIRKEKEISGTGIALVSIGVIFIVVSYVLFNPDSSSSLAIGVLGGTILGSGVAHLLMKTNC